MKTYRTSQVADIIGIHPNTVRLYEKWGLIPAPLRQDNGYRVFTDRHIAQFRLARLAFQIEVLQNGLRKKIIDMVFLSATGDFDGAAALTEAYLTQVRLEQRNTEEAIDIAQQLWSGQAPENARTRRRKEVSDELGVTMDALRNWEMNGLLSVKRRENGYRVYSGEDVRRLKIIRSLRCANYSLEAILRLMQGLSTDPCTNIRAALNTPGGDEALLSACDQLLASLEGAEQNALTMLDMIREMKRRFG